MKWSACLLLVFLLSGCVSKSKSDLKAYQAYMAGQREAGGAGQARTVTILGDVRNHTINWSEDLTLAKAIVAADYRGLRDPHQIFVKRGVQRYPVDVKALLSGNEDPPLEPGDIIDLQ
jgi:hypothetical protein